MTKLSITGNTQDKIKFIYKIFDKLYVVGISNDIFDEDIFVTYKSEYMTHH